MLYSYSLSRIFIFRSNSLIFFLDFLICRNPVIIIILMNRKAPSRAYIFFKDSAMLTTRFIELEIRISAYPGHEIRTGSLLKLNHFFRVSYAIDLQKFYRHPSITFPNHPADIQTKLFKKRRRSHNLLGG